MSAPLLRVTGLTKVYPNGVVALRGVDLTVDEGEFVVVIGRSGSGKSTLLRCLNRLVEPTQGRLEFEGRDVTTCRGAELRRLRRRVGMIFQHFNLVRRATVETNVLTGALESAGLVASLAGFWPRAERERAARTLAEVGLLAQRRRRADSLSGGQQQRVAIARALMQRPRLILADEPVASLDPATAEAVLQRLGRLRTEQGLTVIANLHAPDLARAYATRVVALKSGAVVHDGPPAGIDAARARAIYGDDGAEGAAP